MFLKNVSISGLGGGIGNSGASFNNNVPTFHIKVEDSSPVRSAEGTGLLPP